MLKVHRKTAALGPSRFQLSIELLTSVEYRRSGVFWLPWEAVILHSCQGLDKRVAKGKPASTEGHVVRKQDILEMAFGVATDVVHFGVVILGQDSNEIVREEEGVIVSEHEPVDIGQP